MLQGKPRCEINGNRGAVQERQPRKADALVGASDHGTTKSLYGRDPNGLEFEIAWVVPAALLDANSGAGARIRPLDLAREIARYGRDTLGGVGISRPAPTSA